MVIIIINSQTKISLNGVKMGQNVFSAKCPNNHCSGPLASIVTTLFNCYALRF